MGALFAWRPEHLGDGSQHSLTVSKDFVVPEPENAPASSLQLIVARVVITGTRMLAAIGFDDQARCNAGEVDDVRRDRELASKSPAERYICGVPSTGPARHLSYSGAIHARCFFIEDSATHICSVGPPNPHPNPPPLAGEGIRPRTSGRFGDKAVLDIAEQWHRDRVLPGRPSHRRLRIRGSIRRRGGSPSRFPWF